MAQRSAVKGMRIYTGLLATWVALAATSSPTHAQKIVLDSDLAALVRKLVVESVNGGGYHASQIFVARDSLSESIMRLAGIPTDTATHLNCPGSTDANGNVQPGILGYVVSLKLTGDGDTREVSILKLCTFVYRGGGHGFYQGEDYEVKRENGHWRVTRLLRGVIT